MDKRVLKTASGAAAGAFMTLAGIGAANAAAVLYGVDDASESIVSINTATGEVTVVGAINNTVSGARTYEGLAIDSEGNFYVADANSIGADGSLLNIDPATGAETGRADFRLNTISFGFRMSAIAFDDADNLFGVVGGATDDFVSIDEMTAVYTNIKSLNEAEAGGFSGVTSLTYGPDGLFYGIASQFGGSSNNLVKIDPTTGDTTVIGNIGVNSTGTQLAFDENGTLFAITRGADDRILTLDPLTAAVITNIALGDGFTQGEGANPWEIAGLAFDFSTLGEVDPPSDVPLPAAAWLFLAGIAGVAKASRRKGKKA
ncbi:DUF6923 family protein [Hyphococcus sp.]|jgi:DNA-binding beta-propeller fold protein YncE|uniref:DUF6923 family protein n=1 Tax=Hyphococcus sp. TaxID=2038636 RepID=UPI003D100D26